MDNFWVRMSLTLTRRSRGYSCTGHYTGYLSQVRESHPNAIAFVNPPIFKEPANLPEELKRGRVALSSHYYDGLTMLGKREL
jgi:hypothetical protein